MTPRKALFDVISLLGDLVIAYRTNLVVIVPKAFRTFHDQCRVHIRVFAMFSGTFRVKGGGRFRATTFCFLTIVFSVVVALLGTFSFNAILRSNFLLLLLIFNTDLKLRWTATHRTVTLASTDWGGTTSTWREKQASSFSRGDGRRLFLTLLKV